MAKRKRQTTKTKSKSKGKSSRVNEGTVGMFQNPPKGSGLEDYISKKKYDDLYFET